MTNKKTNSNWEDIYSCSRCDAHPFRLTECDYCYIYLCELCISKCIKKIKLSREDICFQCVQVLTPTTTTWRTKRHDLGFKKIQ